MSNNIGDLKASIWNEWADKNGSIGAAYGHQMRQPVCIYLAPIHKKKESFRSYQSQPQYVIEYLRENPNGRWATATLWNPSQLAMMNLVPCVHTSTWNLDGGRLNCVLDQRSGDMPYGVPFNTTQYAELMCMIARDLGVEPGIMTHVIADAHIYANQMEGVELQLMYYALLECVEHSASSECIQTAAEDAAGYYQELFKHPATAHLVTADTLIERALEALESTPEFIIGAENTDFFSYRADECAVEDYKHMGKIDFGEIAV
jgi:thymidylate synthase